MSALTVVAEEGFTSAGSRCVEDSPRGGFIVDFVCVKHGQVVELDGGQHGLEAPARRDLVRDERLNDRGFRVLRFWNSNVDRNLDGVLFVVDEALKDPTPALRADPPLAGEG